MDATAVVACRIFGYGGLLTAFSRYDQPLEQLLGMLVAVAFVVNANLIRLRMRD